MKVLTSDCVGCPPEMGCLGSSCPYQNVTVYQCDVCGELAEYVVEGQDLCEQCAEDYVFSESKTLDWKDVAEFIGIEFTGIY